MKSILKYLLAGWLPLTGMAQTDTTYVSTSPSSTEHQWLYGVGYVNVLDTYLSPLTYKGPGLTISHRSERMAHWGKGHVTVQGNFGGNVAFLKVPADEDKAWDANFSAGVTWHYNWHPTPSLRLAAGAMGNLGLGFTYLLKSSNNPAQGRFRIKAGFSGLLEQRFHLWKQRMSFRAQLDIPLIGAMFTPNYGQSYYEIFSLGHYDKNVRCTHPFNAPSARLEATFRLPLKKSTFTLGYLGDIRQSHINHLKYHAWNHYFVIGYVRHLQLVRTPK